MNCSSSEKFGLLEIVIRQELILEERLARDDIYKNISKIYHRIHKTSNPLSNTEKPGSIETRMVWIEDCSPNSEFDSKRSVPMGILKSRDRRDSKKTDQRKVRHGLIIPGHEYQGNRWTNHLVTISRSVYYRILDDFTLDDYLLRREQWHRIFYNTQLAFEQYRSLSSKYGRDSSDSINWVNTLEYLETHPSEQVQDLTPKTNNTNFTESFFEEDQFLALEYDKWVNTESYKPL